jgi:MFS family permease
MSALGTQFTQLALPLLVLGATGSPAVAGLVGTLRLLAFTAAQLPGGALADRIARRRMLIVADSGRALALLAVGLLALGGRDTPVLFIAMVIAVEGLLSAAAGSAASAAAPHLVRREEIGTALALNQVQSYTIRLVGPLLGGVLYYWHPAAPFLLDALSYIISLGFLLTVRRSLGGGGHARRRNLVVEIAEGIRYTLRSRYLISLIAWAALANFATAGIGFGMVLSVSGGGSKRLGVAAAVVSLAGLCGALMARRRPAAAPSRLVAATAAMVVLAVAAAAVPGPVVLTLAMAGVAALSPLVSVPLNTRVFAQVPDELMGRVQSSLFLFGGSLYPFAAVITGYLTEHASLSTAMALFASVLGLVLVLLLTPVFRQPAPESAGDLEAASTAG